MGQTQFVFLTELRTFFYHFETNMRSATVLGIVVPAA
jgi:ABC-type phosphate/phosphonate transport system permease subunit